MAGAHELPAQNPAILVEQPFTLHMGGHQFFGYQDIEIPPGDRPVVMDHKFTSDFKWAITYEELATKIQPVLYAAHAMVKYGTDRAFLRWVYYRSKKPYRSTVREREVTRAEIEPGLSRIVKLADDMSLIKRSGLRALDLPPTVTECEAYGGCPYASNCNLSPEQRFTAMTAQSAEEQNKNAFLADVANRVAEQKGAGAQVNPPPPTNAPATGSTPAHWPRDNSTGRELAWDGTTWVPVVVSPPPPPQTPVGPPKRGPGRPPKAVTKAPAADVLGRLDAIEARIDALETAIEEG